MTCRVRMKRIQEKHLKIYPGESSSGLPGFRCMIQDQLTQCSSLRHAASISSSCKLDGSPRMPINLCPPRRQTPARSDVG